MLGWRKANARSEGPSILFVCTGNIFRSVAAEYALRAQLGKHTIYQVGSAGIDAKPGTIHPIILNRLLTKGIDPSRHTPRLLTKQLVKQHDIIIAMGLGHREFIHRQFGLKAPLFNEVSFGTETPILDLHEALPDWERDIIEARAYIESVIDHIWESIPQLMTQLPHFAKNKA